MRILTRAACGSALLLLLGACANGDFGCIKPSLVSDNIHSWVGRQAVRESGYAPSSLSLTDDERQLRDLAYSLVAPPYNRAKWDGVLYEYGIAPTGGPWRPRFDQAAYARNLLDRSVRSPGARYAQLIDDIRNDSVQLAPFVAVARRVLDMDNKRDSTLAYVSSAGKREYRNARRRVAENTLIVAWVQNALRERAAAYRYALERLVVQTPSPQAVQAERALTLLRQQTAAARLG